MINWPHICMEWPINARDVWLYKWVQDDELYHSIVVRRISRMKHWAANSYNIDKHVQHKQQMWHLGTCFRGGPGIPKLMVGLDGLKGLFYDSERKHFFFNLTFFFNANITILIMYISIKFARWTILTCISGNISLVSLSVEDLNIRTLVYKIHFCCPAAYKGRSLL